ncbi:hypothetical protein SDC9_199538 [bioreactor metagenome]|uniref:Uncharacterized protein n=1 Tax=bioreactor metagenome TaxID=1076179 RepID=A0A645IKR4_9ZZZZ
MGQLAQSGVFNIQEIDIINTGTVAPNEDLRIIPVKPDSKYRNVVSQLFRRVLPGEPGLQLLSIARQCTK